MQTFAGGIKIKITCFVTDKQVKAELRLTNEEWSSELSDKTSEKYKALADRVKNAVCILELHTFVTILREVRGRGWGSMCTTQTSPISLFYALYICVR